MNNSKYKIRTQAGYRKYHFGSSSNDVHIDDLYQGVISCTTNPNYPAAKKNQWWYVSTAGKIGGASGTDVEVKDRIICIIDNAGGTEAAVGTSFLISQVNIDPATLAENRTGTSNSVYETPYSLSYIFNGGSAFTSATDILTLSGGSANQLSVVTTAARNGILITGTQKTASELTINTTIDSGNVNVVSNSFSFYRALGGEDEEVCGFYTNATGLSGNANTSIVSCYHGRIGAVSGDRADYSGITIDVASVRDTADTDQAVLIGFSGNQNSASSQNYGVRIAALTGLHTHTHGQWYGVHVSKTSAFTPATTADTATGLYLDGTYTNAIDLRGCLLADEAYTVAGSGTRNHPFINVGSWDSPITINNTLDHVAAIQVNISNTGAASTSNFAAARLRSDTGAASTANHYGLQTRNSVAHNVASAYGINASMNFGTVTIGTGSAAVISAYLEGTGTITPAGANPIDVVNITNVHSGTGVTNCLNVCNNTASTITTLATLSNLQASTLTDAMFFDLQLGTITSVLHVTNVAATTNLIKLSGATNLDAFIDFNDLTAENAHIISTSGTAATTWAARIRVITPDGNPGWINVYSASNEA